MKSVLADPELGISQEVQFERPLHFNVNLDCLVEPDSESSSAEEDFF